MDEAIIVGDIHGSASQLQALLNEIVPLERPLVFLGDYVNRGPNAKDVVEILLRLEHQRHNVTFLCGNHDWAFLQYIEDGLFDRFALLGGLQTLGAYLPENASGNLRNMLMGRIPKSHIQFFRSLRIYYENSKVICSHAGIPPDCPENRSFDALVLGSYS